MDFLDPVHLAHRQIALDRERTDRFPDLFARKIGRMSASPLAFLRGAAPIFFEILAQKPDLADGPAGEGWLVGDAHLENFGAYRPEPVSTARTAKTGGKLAGFNLNDFDETTIGPWRWDVLRLTTSLILGGRELGADGTRVLGLADRLLNAYVVAAFTNANLPPTPRPVSLLIEQVNNRTRRELLDDRTTLHKGQRRFVRGTRYRELSRDVRGAVSDAFVAYTKALPKAERPGANHLEVLDAALRIAGTGSLGSLRVAVLTRGKGGLDGNWIFDMKEQGVPSAGRLLKTPKMVPAARVIDGFRACVEHPPKMLGTTKLAGRSMFVRRLAPQEDKLDLLHLRDSDLDGLAAYLGALLGAAHARGKKRAPKLAWSADDLDCLLDRAIAVAGIHEAIYLALCKLSRVEA